MTDERLWTLLKVPGAVLVMIAAFPHWSVARISRSLGLTERTVLRTIRGLEQSGFLYPETADGRAATRWRVVLDIECEGRLDIAVRKVFGYRSRTGHRSRVT